MNISKEGCIFLLIVRSICELILCPVLRLPPRAELKPAYILLLVVTVTFFTCPDSFTFAKPCSFILVFSQRTVMPHDMRVNKLVRLKLSWNYRRPASLLEKKRLLWSFFCCSRNNSRSFFPFFIFNCIVLFSFCTQIFLSLAVK